MGRNRIERMYHKTNRLIDNNPNVPSTLDISCGKVFNKDSNISEKKVLNF